MNTPERKPRTVMFHIGRCGSGVLADLLKQNPAITWDGELLKPSRLRRQLRPPLRQLRPGTPLRTRAMLFLLRRRMAAVPRDATYGFETKFFHLEREGVTLPRFLDTVRSAGVDRYIVLRRRNALRVVVSGLLADRPGRRYHETVSAPAPEPIVIDVQRVPRNYTTKPLLAFLEHWDHCYDELGRRLDGQSTLALTYEDDVADDPTAGYRRICEYLGVEATPGTINLKPTNPYPLTDLIANLDEVRRELDGTRFAWMVEA